MRKFKFSIAICALALLAIITVACGAVDTIIGALDYGPTSVQRFNLDAETQDRLSHGFRSEADAFRTYKAADKSTPELKKEAKKFLMLETATIISRDFAPVKNAEAQAWINNILALVRIFLGMPPASSTRAMISDEEFGSVAESDEDLHITDDQAKEFERLIKKGR